MARWDGSGAEHAVLRALEEQLAVPGERLAEELARRLEQLRDAERELERNRLGQARERLLRRADEPQIVAGAKILTERVEGLALPELRTLADNLRTKLGSGVVVLGRVDGDKVGLLVAVTADLERRVPAGELVRELGPLIGGGGGGRPDLAEAGGKNPAGLDEALSRAVESVRRRLEA